MNKIFNYTWSLLLLMTFGACKQSIENDGDLFAGAPVFRTTTSIEMVNLGTKTSVTIEGSGNNRVGHLDWVAGDEVGMYVAVNGNQIQQNVKFDNTASHPEKFTGNFKKLNTSSVGGASYYAYYPYMSTDNALFCFSDLRIPDYVAVGEIPVYQEGDFGRYDFMVSTRLQNADYDETALSEGSDVMNLSFPSDRQLFKTLRMVLPRVSDFSDHITKNGTYYDVKVSRIEISADELLTGQFMVDLSAETPNPIFDETAVFNPTTVGGKKIYAAFDNPLVLDDASRDSVFYFTLREKNALTNLKVVFVTQYGQVEFHRSTLLLDGSIKPLTFPHDWEDAENGGNAHWIYPSEDAVYDMSTNGTANCYVMKPNTSYKFKVAKKGNGVDYVNETAEDNALENYSASIDLSSDNLEAVLLWEAVLENDNSTSVIATNGVSYRDSFIYVTTGPTSGNAVVGLRKTKDIKKYDDMIWSWHIWVTDDADLINAKSMVDPVRKIMLRNLGAYDNEALSNHPQNRGMLYQWGRKDPFLPSTGSKDGDYRLNAIGDGVGAWNDISIKDIDEDDGTPMDYSINNPMSFIMGTSASKDWFSENAAYSNNLWGGGYFVRSTDNPKSNSALANTLTNVMPYKTMFDPCPAGYRMPVVGAYGYRPVDVSKHSYVNDIWLYVDAVKGAETIGGVFFPITGRRQYSDGKYTSFDAITHWFGSVAANIPNENFEGGVVKRNYGITMYITKSSSGGYYNGIRIEPSNFAEKAMGRPVRCILEEYFVSYYDWSGME